MELITGRCHNIVPPTGSVELRGLQSKRTGTMIRGGRTRWALRLPVCKCYIECFIESTTEPCRDCRAARTGIKRLARVPRRRCLEGGHTTALCSYLQIQVHYIEDTSPWDDDQLFSCNVVTLLAVADGWMKDGPGENMQACK